MVEGISTESLALDVALQWRVPAAVVSRAAMLLQVSRVFLTYAEVLMLALCACQLLDAVRHHTSKLLVSSGSNAGGHSLFKELLACRHQLNQLK